MVMIVNVYGYNVNMFYMCLVYQVIVGGMLFVEFYNFVGVFGFDVCGFVVQNMDEMDVLKLFVILYWEGQYYVVLEWISGGCFYIQDFFIGLCVFDRGDFE